MEIMPHLKLSDELNIKYAILPGDPARVDRIAEQLEQVQPLLLPKEYEATPANNHAPKHGAYLPPVSKESLGDLP